MPDHDISDHDDPMVPSDPNSTVRQSLSMDGSENLGLSAVPFDFSDLNAALPVPGARVPTTGIASGIPIPTIVVEDWDVMQLASGTKRLACRPPRHHHVFNVPAVEAHRRRLALEKVEEEKHQELKTTTSASTNIDRDIKEATTKMDELSVINETQEERLLRLQERRQRNTRRVRVLVQPEQTRVQLHNRAVRKAQGLFYPPAPKPYWTWVTKYDSD
ncbi:hypothetical protein B0H67DRAFT_613057 [Lasiosphaeris hirsuta]|uniref:Uncharacterized protein n=1 Tax=Lasiosphaeris hirsuta TaxID=260670 RepID=A0AA40DIE5_9PEZI|nr:hypothetical protein B0H67DRAFT_613057 [Lasiosphaeris hirsuta]